jgi:hypothetical protein
MNLKRSGRKRLYGNTDKTTEILSEDNRCPGRDSNRELPE